MPVGLVRTERGKWTEVQAMFRSTMLAAAGQYHPLDPIRAIIGDRAFQLTGNDHIVHLTCARDTLRKRRDDG